MNKPAFRVVAFDDATCDAEYCGSETTTKPCTLESIRLHVPTVAVAAPCPPETMTVRVRDIMPVLLQAGASRRSWVSDFADDPVVITRDLYEVLVTFERFQRAA